MPHGASTLQACVNFCCPFVDYISWSRVSAGETHPRAGHWQARDIGAIPVTLRRRCVPYFFMLCLRCSQMFEINWPVLINLIMVRYLKSFFFFLNVIMFSKRDNVPRYFWALPIFLSFSLSPYVSLLNESEVTTRMDTKMGFDKVRGVNAMKTLIPVKRLYMLCCGLNVSLQNPCVDILIQTSFSH